MAYGLTTVGSSDDGFTSVEIELDGEYVGRVYELESGWYVHLSTFEHLSDPEFITAVVAAKASLLHYVNRKGGDPTGATRAGMSLWLLQRDDGGGFTVSETT
jgi:hypothetical protein